MDSVSTLRQGVVTALGGGKGTVGPKSIVEQACPERVGHVPVTHSGDGRTWR